MALYTSTNWDTGSVPAGWVADSGLAPNTAQPLDGAYSLAQTTIDSTIRTAYWNTKDSNTGNVRVSHFVRFDASSANLDINLFARATITPVPFSGSTYYAAQVQPGGTGAGLVLVKRVAGTQTTPVTVGDATTFLAGYWHYVEMTITGGATPTITICVQRFVDGAWLNSSGSWVTTGRTAAVSYADVSSPITGTGYAGIVTFHSAGSGNCYSDCFTFEDAPSTPSTALYLYPEFAPAFVNHRSAQITVNTNAGGSFTTPITLSDGGAGGRFFDTNWNQITGVTLTNGTPTQTCWYFPAPTASGRITITGSSSGVLTDSPAVSTCIVATNPTSSSYDPTQLHFDQVAQNLPRNNWANLPFDISGGINSVSGYTKVIDVNGGVETVNGNYSRLNVGSANQILYASGTGTPNIGYNVQLQVVSWGGGTTDQAMCGVAADANNYVLTIADNHAGTVTLVRKVTGTPTTLATATISLPVNSTILMQVMKDWAAAWYQRPGDSNYTLVGVVATGFDWTTKATINAFFPCFGTNQAANTAVTVTGFQTGNAGSLGFQNQRFVKDQTTGAPLLSSDGGSVFITSNSGGVNAVVSGVDGAWMIDVWKLNLTTYALTQVSRIWFTRGTQIAADLPVAVGYDPTSKTFTLLSSTWPDHVKASAVQIQYCQTTTNILSPGVYYLANTALPVPGSAAAGQGSPKDQYDPDILNLSGTWYCSFAESDATSFHPRLASAATLGGTWTSVWNDTLQTGYEGTVQQQVGGSRYVLCGSSPTPQLNAYNSADGTLLGSLTNWDNNSKVFSVNPNAGPHPCLMPVPGEVAGQTRYLLFVFDNTGFNSELWNWGNGMLFDSIDRRTASEFTWTKLPSSTGSAGMGIGIFLGLGPG